MPLVMTKDELGRLKRWTDVNREDAETARRRDYVKYLNETSRQMTKHWPNSLENVNKRNEELRRARVEAAEQANAKFYKRYMKRKQEEQEQLMYSARDTVFKNKDAPKMLLGAVIETVVQKEREEQLRFQGELRRAAADRKRQDDEEVMQKARDWHALMALRRQRRFDTNKQHQKEILEQAHEVAERNRTEYETELNLQKIDNIKADQQMEAIKQFEDEFKAAEKARIWSDMSRSREEAAARRRETEARARLDDRLLTVLLQSRARVERQRQQTEKDIKEEKLRVLEGISRKLESGDAAREAKEQATLQKAIQEKEAAAEARREAAERKRLQFKQQRVDERQRFLREEEQRLRDFHTVRQWDIMNRFKNVELCEEFQEKLREEKARKIREYREDILKLWKEREEREARERADTRHFYGELAEQKLRAADNKLLTHAAALLDEARAHGRPPHALHRAIDRYCKLYRLYPMPELPGSLQEHFAPYAPRDRSRPDRAYREPPPPRRDDRDDRDGEHDKRDGLHQPEPSKPAHKEEAVPDYKRAGPANGLQRKPSAQETTLPALARAPRTAPQCACELKTEREKK